jgi:hypothetical protein
MNTPSTETASLAGGCLCGQVRYTARPDTREGYYCHCRMCQLAVGGTRATFINLLKEQVTWQGEPTWYASSRIAQRAFCGRCGTPLAFAYDDSLRMDLTVGSLDDPSAVRPVSHFAIESRVLNWHAEDGLPGNRLDEYDTLMARWRKAYGDDVQPGLGAVRQP